MINNERIITPTEYQEGCAFMDWARTVPLLRKFLIHIPNEGKRSWALGRKFKHLGVKSGVSDYFLPVPVAPYHGLWIELKRTKFYTVSAMQMDWLQEMAKMGFRAEIALGCNNAIALVQDYLHNYNLSTISGDKPVHENV